jgi:integrase
MIPRNPATDVELPRRRRREMRALSPAEAAGLREAVAGTRFEALFLLLIGTGLRPGEALALRWSDVDLEAGRASVRQTLSRRAKGEAVRFDEPKTPRSRRTVPLPKAVIEALRRHKAKQAEERLTLGSAYDATLELVFASETGGPVNYRNLDRRHFKAALKRAGLPETLRLYDLRHSFASLALAAGAHVLAVADRLGHASTKMTLDVYSHTLASVEAEATERIERTIFGG